MADIIRDAPIGQLLRFFTGNKILLYPEEKPNYQCPSCYAEPDHTAKARTRALTPIPSSNSGQQSIDPQDVEKVGVEEPETPPSELKDVEKAGLDAPETRTPSDYDREALQRLETTRSDFNRDLENGTVSKATTQLSRVGTRTALAQSHTQADLEAAFASAVHHQLSPEPSRAIVPQRTETGDILVDWYTTDDPENPQNFSRGKKAVVTLHICLYTMAVYMSSSIYSPSAGGVAKEFHVSLEVASFGLSLYVLAYGIGPLIFSPLSEIPSIGRNPPYMITMGLFVILCVPAALVQNFAGLLVLRFLQGFFGSPCLATGGASLQDMFSLIKLPYILCLWALAAVGGPALGPIISGFSVTAENWRWSIWEMLWLAGPVFISMLLFLPETSTSNILLRRAKRLRKLTGDARLKSQSEIDQANLRPRDVAKEALIRPLQLIFQDPAIGFTAGYVALCYAIFYSFFEVFPLVYIEKYGWNLGELGLSFLAILVGSLISIAAYWSYIYFILEPDIIKNGLGAPERRLIPALIASFFLPSGLFIFAWTGDADVKAPWIAPTIGATLFVIGVFVLMQCVFVYLPLVYPMYAASLFAGNDFARSSIAFAAVQFSRPMFLAMGVGKGTSVLGAVTAACIGGIFILYLYGDRLRARSKFSAK